jgi:hypothetical protein
MVLLNAAPAFNGLEQTLILKILENENVEGRWVLKARTTHKICGVFIPNKTQLSVTTVQQKEFTSHSVFIRSCLLRRKKIDLMLLSSENYLIIKDNITYRVLTKNLQSDYGYVALGVNAAN